MEEKLAVKINALEILEKQLRNRAKKNQHGIIVVSSATDPYLQIEEDYLLTRKMLEIILRYRFPVHIITKSDLVVRDFDLLAKINEQALLPENLRSHPQHKVFVTFSFSTLDDSTAKIFEPGATPPSRRIETLRKTRSAGFQSGVSLMPLLPYISDTDEQLNFMYKTFKDADANYIFPASMTLFGDQPSDSKPLMLRAIQRNFPALFEKYQKLFAYGFGPPAWYRNKLHKKTEALSSQHNIRRSLMENSDVTNFSTGT
jgi:DNA repair photolyase